jgi:hypothetical protein
MEVNVFKKLLPLIYIMIFVLVAVLTGCGPDKTPTPSPKVTDVIGDIQPDEVDLDAAMNATLPGGGTIDDLMDKELLDTVEP